jgi:uncharacterized protein (DUF2252 family)
VEADRWEVRRHYYFGDFARKVVGVGSVGTEAFVMLLIGDRAGKPLFLQVKQASRITSGYSKPSRPARPGEHRAVMALRADTDRWSRPGSCLRRLPGRP